MGCCVKIHAMNDMDRLKSLEDQLATLTTALQEKDAQIKFMVELIQLMQLREFSSRSEKKTDPCGDVFNEAEKDNEGPEEPEDSGEMVTIPEHTRNIPKRKKLPSYLPRIRVEHDLPEDAKICKCGCSLSMIGEEVSEQLDIIPAVVQVIVNARKTYACQACKETIITAPLPPQPIPKSMASPGLLAHIVVSKYCDHLPLYRQVNILNRGDISISRGTLAKWMIQSGELVQPLINLMQEKHLEYDIGYSDETTVQVLKEPNKKPESKSYMWIFGGGEPKFFSWIFNYEPTRSGDVPKAFWDQFEGHIHTDAYSAYCSMDKNIELIHIIKCWAHARRKFAEVAKIAKKRGVSHEMIANIARLYKIEKQMKKDACTEDAIREIRQAKSKPILDEIKAYLDEKKTEVPEKSGLGKAIAYTLNNWAGLILYIEDGRFEIDNNRTERIAKPFAVGRKNWLFSDTVNGAKSSANLYSLIETCKVHGVEPYAYLRHVFTEINKCKTAEDFEKLLPYNCIEMFKPPVTQTG